MTEQLKPGKYKTQGGYEAIVVKVASRQGAWFLRGAIKCPVNHTIHFACWTLRGEHTEHPELYNIASPIEKAH